MEIASFMDKQEELLSYEKELRLRMIEVERAEKKAHEKEQIANLFLIASCLIITFFIGCAIYLRFA